MSARWGVVLLVAGLIVVVGCGPKNAPAGVDLALQPNDNRSVIFAGGTGTIPAGKSSVVGVMRYENRMLDTDAAAVGTTTINDVRPVRAADVVALDLNDGIVAGSEGTTADDGSFRIAVPGNAQFRVAFVASTTRSSGRANLQVIDPQLGQVYVVKFSQADGSPFTAPDVGVESAITLQPIPVAPAASRPAAIANILDAALDASDKARSVNGSTLRLLTLSWNAGVTDGSDFSPTAFGGQPLIRVKGGDSNANDTDEFDDDVIHHEFGHFFVNEVSRDVSLGGEHNLGINLYPTLAYSEGVANWFAGIVRGGPQYIDSVAITGTPSTLLKFTMEGRGGALSPRGITSEATVHEVLWDLSDGVESRADTDNDGLAFAFSTMFAALRSLRNSTVYVVLQDFLAGLVGTGATGTAAIQGLLTSPENQNVIFTGAGDVFPERLEITQSVTDTCVTASVNGLVATGSDSVNRFFRFNLGATTTVSLSAVLATASGQNSNGTNIDLFILDPNNNTLGSSRSETPAEQVRVSLGTGRFYVHVSGRPSPFTNELPNNSSQVVNYRITNQ